MSNKNDGSGVFTPAALGAAALKGAVDVPRSALALLGEQGLRRRLLGPGAARKFSPRELLSALKTGAKSSRGAAFGLLTFPLYAHGVKGLTSEDRTRQALGLAEVLGATAGYAGAKGAFENVSRLGHAGLGRGALAGKHIRGLSPWLAGAAAKGSLNTMAAIVPALAIARGMKKKDESTGKSMLRASVAGAASAGLKGGAERALFLRQLIGRGAMRSPKVWREILAAGGGKAMAGAASVAVLDRLVDLALRSSPKKK